MFAIRQLYLLLLNFLSIQYIRPQSELDMVKAMTKNWTTCSEFLKKTVFDPQSVMDIDWKIFYLWSMPDDYSHQIRFRVPPPALLARYKDLLQTYMNPPTINWSSAVLFYETTQDYSGLLLTTNTSGLFKVLSADHFEFPADESTALFFALKLVDNVLGLMNCLQKWCYALAPLYKFPEHNELTSAAAKLHFHSDIGRSYLASSAVSVTKESVLTVENEDEDINFEDDFVSGPSFGKDD